MLVLLASGLAAIFAADLLIWPGQNLPTLYAILVLVAALRLPPRLVYLVIGSATCVDLVSFDLEVLQPHRPTGLWPIHFLAFVIVAALGSLYAHERARLYETRDALERTVSILDAVLDATENGVIMYDQHYMIRLVNDKLASWSQVSPSELIGHSLGEVTRDIVAPKLAPQATYFADLTEVRAHPEAIVRDEVTQVSPVHRILKYYSGPVYHHGHLIGRIGIYTDITAQRREEQERQALGRVAQALVRKQTLEQVGILIAEEAQQALHAKAVEVWTVSRKRTEAHLLAQRGLSEETVVDLRVLPLTASDILGQVVASGESVEVRDFSRLPLDLTITRKAAERENWRSALYQPLIANGQVVGVLVYITGEPHQFTPQEHALALEFSDLFAVAIAHANLYEEAITHAHEAEDARKHLQLFLSMVVHDLRGPLTVIMGQTQRLLLHPEQFGEREKRGLQSIESATSRMRRLLDDLLDAARIGAERFQVHVGRMDLVEVVSEVVQQEQETTSKHQIHLESPEQLVGIWDAERIAQVFANLISNAIKYSPEGGEILVSLRAEEVQARACVTDQGIGIEPDQLDQLFQPFSRLRPEKGIAGAGLGLYITKGIVDAHRGQITVESEVGKGSTFCVSLPL